MMMMNEPENNLFKDMLSDYVAPISDDGFTDNLLANIAERNVKQQERKRRTIIGTSFFVGGIIAAKQVPQLFNLLSQYRFSTPNLPAIDVPALGMSLNMSWTLAGLALFGLVLWALVDNRDSSIF